MGGIFISYRREEAEGYAGRLFDKLREHFGRERVFMDVDAIEPGVDFVDALNRALESCDVFIPVIGRLWLTVTDAEGKRRLDDPHDYIRLETKVALEREIKVIPILIQETQMPSEVDLPEELKKLARRQALKFSSDRWDYDMGRLIDVLEKALGIVPTMSATPQIKEGRAGSVSAASKPLSFSSTRIVSFLVLVLIIAFSVVYYWQNRPAEYKPDLTAPKIAPKSELTITPTPSQIAPQPNKTMRNPVIEIPIVPMTKVTPHPVRLTHYSVKLSEDRGTVIIVDSAGQETDHISLDPDRVQKIFTAPDGKWSVAVIKVRNRQQYGAMPINLNNGAALETSEIPSMPDTVTFEKMDVVMGFNNSGTKRITLQN